MKHVAHTHHTVAIYDENGTQNCFSFTEKQEEENEKITGKQQQ